jgi:hypothetical protein
MKMKRHKKIKKIVFINLYGLSKEFRTELLSNFFSDHNYKPIHIISNFNHHSKKFDNSYTYSRIKVKVPRYSKNISLKRMYSHLLFSLKAFFIIIRIRPTIVYLKIPSNTILFLIHPLKFLMKFKTIVDVFDLWPESLPESIIKRILLLINFPLNFIRKIYLNNSNLVFLECEYYQSFLKIHKFIVYYPVKPKYKNNLSSYNDSYNPIKFCFLGGINSIINIPFILNFFEYLNYEFHIVGDGNKRRYFLESLKKYNIEFTFHGIIFEEFKLSNILMSCHYGINLINENLAIGLTLKSVDYLRYGIPIINNVPGDSYKLIEEYYCGFNIISSDYRLQFFRNFSKSEHKIQKNNALRLYTNLFEPPLNNNIIQALKRLL